jgi:hypothetical protein
MELIGWIVGLQFAKYGIPFLAIGIAFHVILRRADMHWVWAWGLATYQFGIRVLLYEQPERMQALMKATSGSHAVALWVLGFLPFAVLAIAALVVPRR